MALRTIFLALLLPFVFALTPSDFGQMYHGDGTYYGATEAGNCAIRRPRPKMYDRMVPIAINEEQYDGSASCGACLLVTGSGRGQGANPIRGTFLAYVMDRCPECKHGDIDLSMPGDGRWLVSWKFVPCPSDDVFFLFEGSNVYYWKLQPRGMKAPAKDVMVNGIRGHRTNDNFHIFQDGGGIRTPATISITTVLGQGMSMRLTNFASDGPVYPQGGGSAPAPVNTPRPTRPPSTQPPTNNRRCVPRWRACTGPNNRWGTSKCCRKFKCVRATGRAKNTFVGKRCEPKNRRIRPGRGGRCVPNWKACTGKNNVWGTSRCCGNFRCVNPPAGRPFVGKRCEPRN